MQLLISDANILIDLETADLLDRLFRLSAEFAIPDVLYYEEIEEGTPGLDELGLSLLEVQGEGVTYAFGLHEANSSDVSSHDCLALALARQQECPLLTGDQNLRTLAKQENVEVMGTHMAPQTDGHRGSTEPVRGLRGPRRNERQWTEAALGDSKAGGDGRKLTDAPGTHGFLEPSTTNTASRSSSTCCTALFGGSASSNIFQHL